MLKFALISSLIAATAICASPPVSPEAKSVSSPSSEVDAEETRDNLVHSMLGTFDPLVEHIRKASKAIFPPRKRGEAIRRKKRRRRRRRKKKRKNGSLNLSETVRKHSHHHPLHHKIMVVNRLGGGDLGGTRRRISISLPPAAFYELDKSVASAKLNGVASYERQHIPDGVVSYLEGQVRPVSGFVMNGKRVGGGTTSSNPINNNNNNNDADWKASWSTQEPYVEPLPEELLTEQVTGNENIFDGIMQRLFSRNLDSF